MLHVENILLLSYVSFWTIFVFEQGESGGRSSALDDGQPAQPEQHLQPADVRRQLHRSPFRRRALQVWFNQIPVHLHLHW